MGKHMGNNMASVFIAWGVISVAGVTCLVYAKKSVDGQRLAKIKRERAEKKSIKKGKVHSRFIDNIWGADLVDMQLISKFNPTRPGRF